MFLIYYFKAQNIGFIARKNNVSMHTHIYMNIHMYVYLHFIYMCDYNYVLM